MNFLQHSPTGSEPSLAAAHFRLGNIYERMGKPALAAAEYQATLKDNPQHEEARKALAKLK